MIRLFIALNFNHGVKAQINQIINRVQSNAIRGKFVKEEHMHLTVEFLGEIERDRLDLIKGAMDALDFEAFTLNLTQIGYFKRPEGNIYWLGIKENDTLLKINQKLHQSLIDQGFTLEDRAYRPHITIGRRVKLKDGFNTDEVKDLVGKIEIAIDQVDLMKSETVNGRLVYSVLYSKALRSQWI